MKAGLRPATSMVHKKERLGSTHLLHDGLLLVEALLGSGLGDAAGGPAELPGHLAALGLGSELAHPLLPRAVALLHRPLGALLLGGVTLGHVDALLLLRCREIEEIEN